MEYQSDRTALIELCDFGFKINWTLIKFAYENGYENFLITKEEIINYGMLYLESEECYDENIIDLIDSKYDENDFMDILGRLSKKETCGHIPLFCSRHAPRICIRSSFAWHSRSKHHANGRLENKRYPD